MQKEKLVPAIRFKGFDEEWEVKKINQIFSPIVSNLTMLCIQEKGLYPVYDANNIIGYSSYALSSVPYLTIIKDGAGVGRTRKLPANSSFLGTMTGLIPKNSDIDFTYNLISSLKLEKNFSGSTIPHIYFSDYGKYLVYVPSIIEQEKIGKFFSSLDLIIESQKSKLEKLQTIKQSLWNKMFASENQKIPEIRFKGFEEEWTKEILKKIVTTFSGLTNVAKEDFSVGENYYVTYLNVFSNPMAKLNDLEKVNIHSKQNNLIKGDILVTGSSETPEEVGMTSIWNYNLENVYLNSFCFGLRPKNLENINIDFSAYLFRSQSVRKQIILLAQGISRFNISKNKFLEVSLTFPIYAEQQKIGQFFLNLDSLIQSQELKLEKLNNIKQALLEKMFC
ncbi:restriction endonuclease subunit S [Mycoplasma sp. 1932B]|uniref:restriction endonuclease subunit S n=1 Tax=unclassified Mycoplasma TaxID=2683645 RepID=UPI003AB0B40C